MEQERTFFDFAAYVGLTKHMGGLEATDELLALCHAGEGSHVLDVGCGSGATACTIAKTHGCRVVGVDIREQMVERSREMAEREKVTDRVSFQAGDAQDLPFDDGLFDAVITESVTAFPEDQQKAVREYVRVTKPGGYVGLNESTWLQVPPPPEVVAWASQDVGATVKPLTADEWRGLLAGAGLTEIVAKIYEVNAAQETKKILRRYGWLGMIRIQRRALKLFVRNPAYRQFLKGLGKTGLTPENLSDYFGYGLYVGRK